MSRDQMQKYQETQAGDLLLGHGDTHQEQLQQQHQQKQQAFEARGLAWPGWPC